LVLSLIVIVPAFAVPLSDRTGLKTKFDVDVGHSTYVIETVANFEINDVRFDNDTLVFQISSSLSDNLVELQIPQNITKGAIHMYLDKEEVEPKILDSQKISFVTLEFAGNGTHTLELKSDFTLKAPEPEIIQDAPVDAVAIFVAIAIAAISAGSIMVYKKRKSVTR
jgi:hypothetical protein